MNPHEVRRYSALFASYKGISLDLISKVLLPHQHLKATQLYLMRASDSEAIRWMNSFMGNNLMANR